MLSSQGRQRVNFGICHYYGERWLYVVGGLSVGGASNKVNWCMRFDVNNLKWQTMPDMIEGRYAPGSFISKDDKYLIVF